MCKKKTNKNFIKKRETKMTKFEIATRHEKVLKEIEEVREKLKTMHEDMISHNKYMDVYNLEECNTTYPVNYMRDDVQSKIYESIEACDIAINELKNKLIDKAWHDFYAQEYEGEGEENDQI